MFRRNKNEFLRSAPRKKKRILIIDIASLIFPVMLAVIGIFWFAQKFAKEVKYKPYYTGKPVYILKSDTLFFKAGYRIYNPGEIAAIIISKPFDKVINAVLFNALFPMILCELSAVALFLMIALLRGRGLSGKENLYGTARWGTEKDLARFGLTQPFGVVLAEYQKARLDTVINPANASVSLKLKKAAPLVCHSGGTNTLMIAPTRSGKGVGSIIPTCLSYPESMIIFDPKGELFQTTAGFRQKFSHILKFSPISYDTIRFNPMDEVSLDDQGFADIGLILSNMFEEPKGGGDGTSAFFDNSAKDLLQGLIFHVLTSGIYPRNKQNLNGVLSILSQAASEKGTDADGNELGAGDSLLHEMMSVKHFDKHGAENAAIHQIVSDCASRCLGQHSKVRSDVFSTVFSKMGLFQDPYIANITARSDFKLQDFYDAEHPISLYLTVPFSDVTRIAPVFKLLINFMLNKFSRGEAAYGEVKLKHRILFLIDEFPVLGHFPFLSKTLGILAGYGITFYIVVQAINQIVDIYGQHHTFLDNCKTVVLYAPGKIEDAKSFSEMIGKESVVHESISVSGSRYGIQLNNLNASGQEIARDLINPDELMKLPMDEALIINQGMPPYRAKKVCYYMDERFKWKAWGKTHKLKAVLGVSIPFSEYEVRTGFPPPATRAELEAEARMLPSQKIENTPPAATSAVRAEDFDTECIQNEYTDSLDTLDTEEDTETETVVSAAAGNNAPPAAAEDASPKFEDFDPTLYIMSLDEAPPAEDAAGEARKEPEPGNKNEDGGEKEGGAWAKHFFSLSLEDLKDFV